MRARALIAGIAAALLIPIGSAAAQEELNAGEIDATAHPTVEVVVSTPGGAGDSDFTITEGDTVITPTVEALSAGEIEVVLTIDTSGSMNGAALASAKSAALGFIDSLPAEARVAVIGFGPTPVAATQLTSDRGVIAAAIQSLSAGGETALYDAVVVSTVALENSRPGARRALVVLSDGGDTVSSSTLGEAADFAAGGFDVVHAIGLQTGEQDTASLDRIVSGGGSVVEARDPVALSAVYTDVANRIVNQYSLTWETTVSADTDVAINFSKGSATYEAVRTLDVDESLVVPPADPPPKTKPDPATDDVVPKTKTDPAADALTPVENSGTLPGAVLIVGLVTMFGALFLAGLAVFAPRERRRNLAAEFRQRVPRGRQLTGAGKRLVETVEAFLRKDPDRHSGLALRLERAGLDWTPAEFGAVMLAGGAVLAVLGFGIFRLFGLLLFPVVGVFAGLAVLDHRAKKRSDMFTAQLDGTLQLIAGSLRSGFGIMQALGTVAEETEWPTNEEFTRVLGEVRLGRDLGDALASSAVRVNSEDYGWVVQAIEISREVGGNLAEVLDNVSGTIRQRNTLRRQVRALSAEGRMSALILFLLPFVMFAWMKFSNADYIDLLFERTGGQIAIAIGLGLMVIGAMWMRKIVEVKF